MVDKWVDVDHDNEEVSARTLLQALCNRRRFPFPPLQPP